jgi:type III restriction enzyme
MIELKEYQKRALDSLKEFFKIAADTGSPGAAFRHVTRRQPSGEQHYLTVALGGLGDNLPYVCLRVPTGGGKTLMACHAAGGAIRDFMRAERGMVLWLVPSNTILEQTARALRDPRHPYRHALEKACGGAVATLTVDEALRLSRATADGATVVIVATIQSFRVKDKDSRKVYDADNGYLPEHFLNISPQRLADLKLSTDGQPEPSLANVLRLRRPVVIVDEAHNARTDLSFATLAEVGPSCIVEFTATPASAGNPSNVLHRVSAAELQAEDMIKLPLRVVTRTPYQREELLGDAVALRADLEKIAAAEAQQTGEYLRPLMLVQAERVDDCEKLRETLTVNFNVPREQVVISTSQLDELKDLRDMASPDCAVRFIITVQKLREGWDCPFAYVLCSLQATRSATAIEQIVGRVLRLPGAARKQNENLNCAYAYSVSEHIEEVLAELTEALRSNGFTKVEAERIIIATPPVLTVPLTEQPRTVNFAADHEIDAVRAEALTVSLRGKVLIDAAANQITVLRPLDEQETAALTECVQSTDAKRRVADAIAEVRATANAFAGAVVMSPSARREPFTVPLLAIPEGDELVEFEKTHLLHPWRLSEKDATLPADYDPRKKSTGKRGEVYITAAGDVKSSLVNETTDDFVKTLHQQTLTMNGTETWIQSTLVAWLDKNIEHRDIAVEEAAGFLRKVILALTARFGLPNMDELVRDRFRLRDKIANLIQQHREHEARNAFQSLLLDDSPLTVSDALTLDFSKMTYEPNFWYDGDLEFKKHYHPKPGDLRQKTNSGEPTEEFNCAAFLDKLPEVKFWLRNIAHRRSSFRLQTLTDYFYPDFVCELNDGRILAVEYKGGHLVTADDAEEKANIGAVWANRSNGKCLFVMPQNGDFSRIEKIIR